NKQLLKERLGAIMRFRKKSTAIRCLTGVLTLCVIFGAAFVGVYHAAAASGQVTGEPMIFGDKNPTQTETGTHREDYASQAERYYEAGSVPLFQIAFSRLDETAQEKWLDKIYADGDIAFAAAAIDLLGEDCAIVQRFAERAYEDANVAFFSRLVMHMSENTLEMWLDKALEDGGWAFQSILFNALDRDDEFDDLEKKREEEWAKAQMAEYQAVDVTIDGKNYYYQGQLVNIFLDIRANKSFYTLDMNPDGVVNIKIIRDADNVITGVDYLTEAEIIDLFDDENS
ncbi:MAG: hypothetical protein K2K87_09890, partial [Lachnospiraceae bacterium]|nr:hypothetical protein [Lachnospiraceae bacterium]